MTYLHCTRFEKIFFMQLQQSRKLEVFLGVVESIVG